MPGAQPAAPPAYDASADTDPAALDDFRDTLAPYGSWREDPTYGTVWVPSADAVGEDFTPYVSNGHWALADDGDWMWVSDFNWGWAPFHYGRWLWIPGRGWGWVPGRVYSNAWVVWRTGYYDDYYVGWAPMPPTWYWRAGFAYGLYYVPPAPYVFCESRYAFYPHVHSYIVPAGRVGAIAARTQPYVAASASVGPTTYRSATYRSAAMTRGPSMGEAHVPPANVPTQRVAPDRRITYTQPASPRSYVRPQPGSNVYTRPSPQPYDRPYRGGTVGNPWSRPAPAEIPRPVSPSSPSIRPSVPSYNPPRSDARVFSPPAARPAAPAPVVPSRPSASPLRKIPARR
jgi:hypothetical protein